MANEKQQFVDELKELLQKNVAEVKEQVETLKTQFYRQYHQELEAQKKAAQEAAEAAGEVLENWVPAIDELEQEFRELLAQYKQQRAELQKQVEEEQAQNLLRKENILAQMKEMADAETADVMDNLKKMRELQAEWKTIGPVPATKTQEIWKNYQQYQERFYDLVKINIELRDLDFKKNLEMKILLCEAAEKLQENPNIVEASRALQQLHDEWAEIGPVARELREDLWNRFKQASSIINKKHQAYFDELHAKENENLEKKQALIQQLKDIDVKALKSNKQWEEATEKVQAIQQEWRTIGFAPKKQNQTIYNEYRELCEAFFKAKTSYYKSIRDEFSENLKKKRELVEAAEALKDSTEWTETTNRLIELQQQWKKIGPVARKYSDDLWKKFTAACDAFFEAKREATKEQREQYAQKRAEAKERWAKKVDSMTDRQKLVKMYENLVQEIKTAENNILFFTGKSKTANKLVEDMRKKIETLKEQLNDLEQKINQLDAE
jgi:chromosome segregation ATPase